MSLSARNLTVRIDGRAVVEAMTVDLRAGEVTAVVGPNGAGKSTFLTCLAGLRTPQAGDVVLDGRPLLRMNPRERARTVGFLEQSSQVAWAVDVRTLVGLGRTPYLGASGLGAEDAAAVEAAMATAQVDAFADRLVTTLSGGERSRVLIARALAGAPRWLLADEPLAGLDLGHQLDASHLFRDMAAEGRGVVVTIHDLTLAARTADRIIVIHEGRVLADGAPRESLTPETLRIAYGVEAELAQAPGGLAVEVVRRLG